jgi:aldehyde:ferredoxin oxidoreductase
MPNGYNGKILHVDLTEGTLIVEEPVEAFYRKYMGGSAMGMYYILRDMPKGADPIGPDNVLTLMTGVTTGAAIWRSSSPSTWWRTTGAYTAGRCAPSRRSTPG